ncbi:MAG TPA: hypothetical protein VII27_02380 [Thermoplasmata archaeon]
MKPVYCSDCDAVSALATMEREACHTCGQTAPTSPPLAHTTRVLLA